MAATPGSSLPSSSSSDAPPPVETPETRAASPSSWSARPAAPPEPGPRARPPRAAAAADGIAARVGARLRDRLRPRGEARPLEDAHRPVPEDRLRPPDDLAEAPARLGPDVDRQPPLR